MTPEQFAYWLQGFVELNRNSPSEQQWDSIKEHLQTVFKKVTHPLVYQPAPNPFEAGVLPASQFPPAIC